MKRWSIRVRLTLLFTIVQCLFFGALATLVYRVFSRRVMAELDLGLRDKAEALSAAYEPEGTSVEVEMDERIRDTLWTDSIAQIRTPEGKILFQNQFGPLVPLPAPPSPSGTAQARLYTASLPKQGAFRCAWQTNRRSGKDLIILVGAPLKRIQGEQAELLRILAVASLGAVAVFIIVGWLVIGRLLRPLAILSSKARHITAEHLHDRLAVPNPHDEIGQLAETLNGMIERLQISFEQMRRFTADASHELRTPLTCMRSEVEVALQQSRRPEEYREVLGSILEEIERLGRLSDTLLTLTRLDQGQLAPKHESVDLAELLREMADRIRVQAEARGATLSVAEGLGRFVVEGDRRLLEQAALNLLDNAIKYGGHEIRAELRRADGQVILAIHDSGAGIPAEHLDRLFDRFYRVEKSRSRELGGVGLGLSLVKHFVELHGGRMTVRSSPGKGTTFEIFLPELAG